VRGRLVRGEVLLLDGAMGTELGRRGVATPLPLWSAEALRTAPDVVQAIHEDYARAGADVLTTATFRTTARSMRRAGRPEEDAATLTRGAVAAARAARDRAGSERDIRIAGAMAPLEDCYRPELAPVAAEAASEHGVHAALLAEAGVDLILVETMNSIVEAVEAVRAAVATGLPVFVSFLARDDRRIWNGDLLEDAVRAVDAIEPDAILINCVPLAIVGGCLERMARATRRPIGCYPNAGRPDLDGGTWIDDAGATPERFAAHAGGWLRLGALVVGGCCGTGPEHTRALRASLPPVLLE
jgi:S-methylmethionine-dependent homocysteine/selenocysteine methylase